MKCKLETCSKCGKEARQDVGMKQGTSKTGGYIRRRTIRCRRCGTRQISNIKKGRRIVSGKNQLPEEKR